MSSSWSFLKPDHKAYLNNQTSNQSKWRFWCRALTGWNDQHDSVDCRCLINDIGRHLPRTYRSELRRSSCLWNRIYSIYMSNDDDDRDNEQLLCLFLGFFLSRSRREKSFIVALIESRGKNICTEFHRSVFWVNWRESRIAENSSMRRGRERSARWMLRQRKKRLLAGIVILNANRGATSKPSRDFLHCRVVSRHFQLSLCRVTLVGFMEKDDEPAWHRMPMNPDSRTKKTSNWNSWKNFCLTHRLEILPRFRYLFSRCSLRQPKKPSQEENMFAVRFFAGATECRMSLSWRTKRENYCELFCCIYKWNGNK